MRDAARRADFSQRADRALAALVGLLKTGRGHAPKDQQAGACPKAQWLLAVFALEEDRAQEALSLAEAALELATAARDDTAVADAHGTGGHAALALGDLARASRAFAEELRICRQFAYFELVPDALLGVAAIAAERRDVQRAGLLAGAARTALRRRLDLVYLMKRRDEGADARRNPQSTQPESVLSGRTVEQVAAGG